MIDTQACSDIPFLQAMRIPLGGYDCSALVAIKAIPRAMNTGYQGGHKQLPGKVHYTASGLHAIRIKMLGAVCANTHAIILFFCKKQTQIIIIAGIYLRFVNACPCFHFPAFTDNLSIARKVQSLCVTILLCFDHMMILGIRSIHVIRFQQDINVFQHIGILH